MVCVAVHTQFYWLICMREVYKKSLDHTFTRHFMFQSISKVFHHTSSTHTHTHGDEEGDLAFLLIRKWETLVSWVFTLINRDSWGWANIWVRCVQILGRPGGWGAMGLEGVVDQMTLRVPRDARLKQETMMFGLYHAGSAALFWITHFWTKSSWSD